MCQICNGHGMHPSGRGELIECKGCLGKTTIRCEKCTGSGWIGRRHAMIGGVYDTIDIECTTCEGSGRIVCAICYGEKQFLCQRCDGTGFSRTRRCSKCKGNGDVTVECSNCSGTGKVETGDKRHITCNHCDSSGAITKTIEHVINQ